jgi:hypothetical protein
VNSIHEQARDRQRAILSAATENHTAQQVRRIDRAARRAERAERHLSRSWHEALRRRAELKRLAADSWN